MNRFSVGEFDAREFPEGHDGSNPADDFLVFSIRAEVRQAGAIGVFEWREAAGLPWFAAETRREALWHFVDWCACMGLEPRGMNVVSAYDVARLPDSAEALAIESGLRALADMVSP